MSSRRLVRSAIDPHSRVPKYLQLKAKFMREIQEGRWAEGARFASDQELTAQLGVSRMTVRQAVAELVNDGFLRRDHGKGTFVTRPRALRRFWTVISFTEEMRSRGLEVGNKLLGVRRVIPSGPIRKALRLGPGERVLQIRRIRTVHDQPIAYNVSNIPLSRCPDLDRCDLEEDSLYTIIQNRYGYRITRGDRTYRAAKPSRAEAALLGVAPGGLVLVVEGTTFVDREIPIDYCYEIYRE